MNIPEQEPTQDELNKMLIDFQLYRMKQNEKKFLKSLDDFINDCDSEISEDKEDK